MNGSSVLMAQTNQEQIHTTKEGTANIPKGFSRPELAIDSVFQWAFERKSRYHQFGLLDKIAFIQLTRLTDTLISLQNIQGNWIQYSFRFERSLKKIKKYGSKRGIRANRIGIDQSGIIRYDKQGLVKNCRLEVPFKSRKKDYILRLDFFEWEGLWYFQGKGRIYLK